MTLFGPFLEHKFIVSFIKSYRFYHFRVHYPYRFYQSSINWLTLTIQNNTDHLSTSAGTCTGYRIQDTGYNLHDWIHCQFGQVQTTLYWDRFLLGENFLKLFWLFQQKRFLILIFFPPFRLLWIQFWYDLNCQFLTWACLSELDFWSHCLSICKKK